MTSLTGSDLVRLGCCRPCFGAAYEHSCRDLLRAEDSSTSPGGLVLRGAAMSRKERCVSEAFATEIGALCTERGWSRSRLIQELRKAAKVQGAELPEDGNLNRMIRMWSSGDRGLSMMYAEILSAVFEVRFVAGKVARPPEIARRSALTAGAVIAASARQSAALIERLAVTVDPIVIDQFADDVDRLAIDYISSPPATIAEEAKLLRDSVAIALERTRRPSQIQDLYLLAGRLGGILAYAALDLGSAKAAMANARSALMCADLSGHQSLAVWVRGTQSLIARFARRYDDAEKYLQDGMNLGPRGIGLARLASSQAQTRAHFGDVSGTREALRMASDAHAAAEVSDAEIGLFGFPRSKVHYYAASSLIWLPNGVGAQKAVSESAIALQLFRADSEADRFVTDEILTYVYGATAHVQQGQIEDAAALLRPIFETPEDQRVSWHRQRLGRIVSILQSPKFNGSRRAADLVSAIAAF